MAIDYSIPGKGNERKTNYVIDEYGYDSAGKIIERPWDSDLHQLRSKDSDHDSDIHALYARDSEYDSELNRLKQVDSDLQINKSNEHYGWNAKGLGTSTYGVYTGTAPDVNLTNFVGDTYAVHNTTLSPNGTMVIYEGGVEKGLQPFDEPDFTINTGDSDINVYRIMDGTGRYYATGPWSETQNIAYATAFGNELRFYGVRYIARHNEVTAWIQDRVINGIDSELHDLRARDSDLKLDIDSDMNVLMNSGMRIKDVRDVLLRGPDSEARVGDVYISYVEGQLDNDVWPGLGGEDVVAGTFLVYKDSEWTTVGAGASGALKYIGPLNMKEGTVRFDPPENPKFGYVYRSSTSGFIDSDWGFDSETLINERCLVVRGDSDWFIVGGGGDTNIYKSEIVKQQDTWHMGPDPDIVPASITAVDDKTVTFNVMFEGNAIGCTATTSRDPFNNTGTYDFIKSFGLGDRAVSGGTGETLTFVFDNFVRLHMLGFAGRGTGSEYWQNATIEAYDDTLMTNKVWDGNTASRVLQSNTLHALFCDPNINIRAVKVVCSSRAGSNPGTSDINIWLADERRSFPWHQAAVLRSDSRYGSANGNKHLNPVTTAFNIRSWTYYNDDQIANINKIEFINPVPYRSRTATAHAMTDYDNGGGILLYEYNNKDDIRTDIDDAVYFYERSNSNLDTDVVAITFMAETNAAYPYAALGLASIDSEYQDLYKELRRDLDSDFNHFEEKDSELYIWASDLFDSEYHDRVAGDSDTRAYSGQRFIQSGDPSADVSRTMTGNTIWINTDTGRQYFWDPAGSFWVQVVGGI